MDERIVLPALAFLAFGLALNLHLTFALQRRLRQERDTPAAPQPGDALPQVRARALAGGAREALTPPGTAHALLFLSSRCDKCRGRLAEIDALRAPARAAGLALHAVSTEPRWRLRRFLAGTGLPAIVRRVARADYRLLNPALSAPAYLFVGGDGRIEASGLVGDADWQSLCAQLAQAAETPAAAAA